MLLRIDLITNYFSGFGDRLLNEVKKLALKDVKIKIYAPPERKYSTWIGGSILAGLNAFTKVRKRWFQGGPSLNPLVDVGISGGISGRSRRDPQKVWLLDRVFWPSLSYSIDSIPSHNIRNTCFAIFMHAHEFSQTRRTHNSIHGMMMLCTDNEHREMQQNDQKKQPAPTCPSLVARRPWISWYHGTVERKISDTTSGEGDGVGLTFLARFFRSFRSFRVGLSFFVTNPD